MKEWDEQVFVVFDVHEKLLANIFELSKYNWTLWIESYGNIKGFQWAKWKSKSWKNGLVINIQWTRIDMWATYQFPSLLEDNILIKKPLDFSIWKDEKGWNLVFDLAKLPHLLVASETWWWKSVAMTNILVSLMKNRIGWHPIKFMIVDPKKVEFSLFEWLENFNITTEIDKGLNMAKWLVAEMLKRYSILQKMKLKNIKEYHENGFRMDYILFIVDEFADIMTQWWDTAKEFENAVIRLTQLARAVGIHVVLATQNPIGEVITSNIKANMTSRLWFRTSDSIKSRTIIDSSELASIQYKGEWYMKTWEWLVHLKSYYIDNETELKDFIAYYKRKTTWKSVESNEQQKLWEEQMSVPVHHKNKHHVIHKFEDSIDEWEYHIDKMSSSFLILRELVKEWGYKSRKDFFERLKKYNISKGTVEKLINNLKQKELIEYVESAKINKIAKDIDHKYLNELYASIYSVIQK